MNEGRHLHGLTAWVTGSSRGLGRAVAERLAAAGACVAVHGTTPTSTRSFNEADSLQAVAQTIAGSTGSTVIPVHGDLTQEKVVQAVAAQIRGQLGRIDILVNCAGGDIGSGGVQAPQAGKPAHNDALSISLEDLRVVLDRNLMTCILCCREVAPEMIQRRGGKIVNFGSIAGAVGLPESVIYCTAKAAVHEYTRCLAAQLRAHNVNVNAVAPGDIVTARFAASRTVEEAMMVEGGTLQRYGRPREVAAVVEFLVSEAGGFVSGQVIRIDGAKQLFPI